MELAVRACPTVQELLTDAGMQHVELMGMLLYTVIR